jgi:hypothetical protein
MTTVLSSPGFGSIIHSHLNPESFMATNTACAIGWSNGVNMWVSNPLSKSKPTSGLWPGGCVTTPPSGQLIHSQPAPSNASAISLAKSIGSAPTAAKANFVPLNIFNFSDSSDFCCKVSRLGANRVSSAMIFDCWTLLIPSSKPNSKSVQTASIATPPTTSKLANDHFGFSRTIPIATAKLATIAAVNNTAWGQVASREPEKNPLTWLYLTAADSWLLVAIIAVAKMALDPKKALEWQLQLFPLRFAGDFHL